MKPRPLILLPILVLALAGGGAWWLTHRVRPTTELVLYGNVDLREVELAFNGADRVAEVLVSEGDRVKRGQVLARLDTGRLAPAAAQAAAQADAQAQVVDRLHHGSRPEDIRQARASVAVAQADAQVTRARYDRLAALTKSSGGRALSRQELDDARAAADAAEARLEASRQTLALQQIGPRREDIAQAEAQLRGARAQQALANRQLADAALVAPMDAVVRSRLIEPGDMASPQKPALALAITNPKWVRAYVTESDLGHVRPGLRASISADAFKDRAFPGWIGFVSPVAEFTPKTVQTTDLRTSLVYEIRVFVTDPDDDLRLGMPATVRLPLAAASPPGRR